MPPKLVQGFTITVDGKTLGPYRSSQEDKIKNLMHLKGITVNYGLFSPADILPPPRKRQKKPENLSLLDGLDFTPISRKEAV